VLCATHLSKKKKTTKIKLAFKQVFWAMFYSRRLRLLRFFNWITCLETCCFLFN